MSLKLYKFIYKQFAVNRVYKGGRNRMGRITISHRGSSCALKRKYLNIDLTYSLTNISYILLQIRPVARRTGMVGLILYKNGLFSYILVSKNVSVGMIWSLKFFRVYKEGDYLKLLLIPEGFSIYNVELYLGRGGQLGLSAGTSVKIINRYSNKYYKMLVKLRSGEEYFINSNCGANLGVCSNTSHWLRSIKKAGTKRLFGFRSHVRGVAMNPVDHPHGGNTAGGHPCMTPKGLLTKGVKTRKNPLSTKVIYKRRSRLLDKKKL